jgi:hypothetical protein
MFLWNIDIYLQVCTILQLRRTTLTPQSKFFRQSDDNHPEPNKQLWLHRHFADNPSWFSLSIKTVEISPGIGPNGKETLRAATSSLSLRSVQGFHATVGREDGRQRADGKWMESSGWSSETQNGVFCSTYYSYRSLILQMIQRVWKKIMTFCVCVCVCTCAFVHMCMPKMLWSKVAQNNDTGVEYK